MGTGPDRTDRSIRADFPGGFPGDPVNSFTSEGRTGDAAVAFQWMRGLLQFRREHPALRRGGLTQLLVNQDQYAYLRNSPEEYVLVVLNRSGSGKPMEIEVDDFNLPEASQFRLFAGVAPLEAAAGNLLVLEPKPIQIYWAPRRR